jgi:hypothetical protein
LYKGENIWFGNRLLWREKGSLWPDFNLDFSGETQQRGFLETAPGNDRGIEKERDRETELTLRKTKKQIGRKSKERIKIEKPVKIL